MSVWVLLPELTEQEQAELQNSMHLPLPFVGMPDLTDIQSPQGALKLLRQLHPEEPPEAIQRRMERFWHARTGLAPDDVVAVRLSAGQVAIAQVTGRYTYDSATAQHLLPVKWHGTHPMRAFGKNSDMFKSPSPLREITDREERISILEKLPHSYNRFSKLKWILKLFVALSLLQLMRGSFQ